MVCPEDREILLSETARHNRSKPSGPSPLRSSTTYESSPTPRGLPTLQTCVAAEPSVGVLPLRMRERCQRPSSQWPLTNKSSAGSSVLAVNIVNQVVKHVRARLSALPSAVRGVGYGWLPSVLVGS